MNEVIVEWIERLNNGETIPLLNISELTDQFSEIDISSLFPSGISELNNIVAYAMITNIILYYYCISCNVDQNHFAPPACSTKTSSRVAWIFSIL